MASRMDRVGGGGGGSSGGAGGRALAAGCSPVKSRVGGAARSSSRCPSAASPHRAVVPPRRQEHATWVKLQTCGPCPSPRSGHDVAVVGTKLYLFGGCGGDNDAINCLDDLYSFDLETHRWERVPAAAASDLPTARASFGMCNGPDPFTVIVAGGTGVEMDSLRSDVMSFDTRTRRWRKLNCGEGETPSRFYGQTVCRYGSSLLLFGGSTGLHYTNDLFEYNLETNSYRKLVTHGRRPSPRYKHQVRLRANALVDLCILAPYMLPPQMLNAVSCLTMAYHDVVCACCLASCVPL